jgi:hypothetical protein
MLKAYARVPHSKDVKQCSVHVLSVPVLFGIPRLERDFTVVYLADACFFGRIQIERLRLIQGETGFRC